MPRPMHRTGLTMRRALAGGLLLGALACGGGEPAVIHTGVEGGQWRAYGGDPGGTKYSPLDQIDASNVADLEIAWEWEPPDVQWREDVIAALAAGTYPYKIASAVSISDFQDTPLMVDGVLYGVTPAGMIFAVDAGSGEERWVYDPQSYASSSSVWGFLFPKHRGVTYWTDGRRGRIFIPTIDAWLIALDARTGKPVESFGEHGRVDLIEGLRHPRVERLEDWFNSSPAGLYRDTLIVGGSINDRPKERKGIPGDIRAYDVRTGALKWTFHTVPAEGETGSETWEEDSWRMGGAANAWGPFSVDVELGRVYIQTSTPTNDMYGGHRPGNNLFAETLLCLDAETGERIWHYQLIHHGLWDYDVAAPPVLVDISVDGKRIPAVAQATKQGFVFVFDRVTGEPVWPIEEQPVPASDVPGERAAATQPFPTRPPPFERQGVSEEDLIDFTPELHAMALEIFHKYRSGPLFSPPSLEGTMILPGPPGGTNWQGAGVDPESGVMFVPSMTQVGLVSVQKGHLAVADFRYVTGRSDPLYVPGERWSPDGLPLIKPPYSRITAIDLNRGEILWQVPNGDGPRDNPHLAGLDLPPLGGGGAAGVVVTRSLLFAGEGAALFLPNLGEPKLRAFDKRTGEVLAVIDLPAKVRGVPMTYMYKGKQYVVAALGDTPYQPRLVALALP